MKKIIVCLILVFTIMLGLCACYPKTIDEQGVERTIMDGFVVISATKNDRYIVYDQTTKVVYYLESDSYNGYLSPYLIHQDGYIYGAIFQDGKITPVPYATSSPN